MLRATANFPDRATMQVSTCHFHTSFDESSLAFLKDHVVNGSAIFPGAGFMEAANAVSTPLDADEKNTTLNAVAFIRPLMFQAGIGISVVSSDINFPRRRTLTVPS